MVRAASALACSVAAAGLCGGAAAAAVPSERNRDWERKGAELVRLERLPLRTNGRYIVDRGGERVKWACVNWYGSYSTTHAVGGLEVQPMQRIVDRIVEFGFNCVRLMYSLEGFFEDPVVSNATLAANRELWGMRSMELFDLAVQKLTDAGLMVIVNNHVSASGWCCHYSQDEGLWYTPQWNESMWLRSLVEISERYRGNPLVVAIDLRNEVHDYKDVHLTWGTDDPLTDWGAAATRAGNAVLEASPDVLIVVMAMCFGADLRPMRQKPVQLMYPNRVIYQTHNYLEYQFFEAITSVLTTWAELRTLLLALAAALILALVGLWHFWVRNGKPLPTHEVLFLSLGSWVALFGYIAAIASNSAFSFACKFCSSGAHSDIKPWLIGGAAVGSCGVLTAAIGGFRIWRRQQCCCGRRRSECGAGVASPSSNSTAPVAKEMIILTERGAGQRDVTSAATTSSLELVDALNLPVPSDRGAFGGATGEVEADCGETSEASTLSDAGQETTAASLRAAEDFAPPSPLACGIWSPGFASCRRAWGRPPFAEALEEQAAWDTGLCLSLQLLIVLFVLLLVATWFYIFAHILPTYWWMERHLDGLWGFALEEGHPFSAPVWMGEFGQHSRGHYWLNFVRYLSARDVDFAYWAINGIKWSEGDINNRNGEFTKHDTPHWTNESFGLLTDDYWTVQHTWKLLDLQALMESPAKWIPDTAPCDYTLSPACGG